MYSVVRNVDCITAYMHACVSHYIYCACNTIKKHVYAKKKFSSSCHMSFINGWSCLFVA